MIWEFFFINLFAYCFLKETKLFSLFQINRKVCTLIFASYKSREKKEEMECEECSWILQEIFYITPQNALNHSVELP